MFEIEKTQRAEVVNTIVNFLPKPNQDNAKKTIDDLANRFEGQDTNTIGLLYRAAEVGRFDDYVSKLQEYYDQEGKFISVNNRSEARNQNIEILRDIVKKEQEIADKTRPKTDRSYWPSQVQTLATHYLGSVKMELFFVDCFQEIMEK